MSYQGYRFNCEGVKLHDRLDGELIETPPVTLSDTYATSVVLACSLINGTTLIISRHWALVGNDKERILVCQSE